MGATLQLRPPFPARSPIAAWLASGTAVGLRLIGRHVDRTGTVLPSVPDSPGVHRFHRVVRKMRWEGLMSRPAVYDHVPFREGTAVASVQRRTRSPTIPQRRRAMYRSVYLPCSPRRRRPGPPPHTPVLDHAERTGPHADPQPASCAKPSAPRKPSRSSLKPAKTARDGQHGTISI